MFIEITPRNRRKGSALCVLLWNSNYSLVSLTCNLFTHFSKRAFIHLHVSFEMILIFQQECTLYPFITSLNKIQSGPVCCSFHHILRWYLSRLLPPRFLMSGFNSLLTSICLRCLHAIEITWLSVCCWRESSHKTLLLFFFFQVYSLHGGGYARRTWRRDLYCGWKGKCK